MSRETNAAAAIRYVQEHVPNFKVVPKAESSFMRFLAAFMGLFGQRKQFLERFSTTIGYTAYLIERHALSIGVILHEGRHAHQSKKYTRVIMGMLYLFPLTLGIIGAITSLTSPYFHPSASRIAIQLHQRSLLPP